MLVLATRLLGFARSPKLLDAGLAAGLVEAAVPGFRSSETALSRDGAGALVAGLDGRVALVRPLGDRFVVRLLQAALVGRAGGVLRVRPDEAMFPETALDLGEAASDWARRL